MTHASLFSGIGGPDLAAEWMGWRNVFHCEKNQFGQKVLKFHFPESIPYENIITTDFTIHRGGVDVLTGGFPCQPFSVAGLRRGKEDSRHLWPEMLRAIREIQPPWIVGENVLGIINWSDGMVFDEVQTDLEAEGYEVQPYVLPAISINAPHRRDRVWFVAYSNSFRTSKDKTKKEISNKAFRKDPFGRYDTAISNEDWHRAVTSYSGIFGEYNGLPTTVDRITALGNAIVPQVIHQIFKAIQAYEDLTTP